MFAIKSFNLVIKFNPLVSFLMKSWVTLKDICGLFNPLAASYRKWNGWIHVTRILWCFIEVWTSCTSLKLKKLLQSKFCDRGQSKPPEIQNWSLSVFSKKKFQTFFHYASKNWSRCICATIKLNKSSRYVDNLHENFA